MGRAFKYLFRLIVLAAIGLGAYALLADLPAPVRTVEVELAVPPGEPQPQQPPEPSQAAPAPAPAAEETPPGIMQE